MDVLTRIARARSYLARLDPAVSGAGGHNRTMYAAACLVQKFGLTIEQAWPLLLEYNDTKCSPKWTARELLHKLEIGGPEPSRERTEPMSDVTEAKKPLVSFSVGSLSVSLWQNDVGGSDRKFKTVTIRKAFPGKDGEMDSRTVSINPAEVGCLAGLLTRMEEAVIQAHETTPF